MNSRLLPCLALSLLGASCASRRVPSSDWPPPVPLERLSQLGGVYRNEGEGGGAYGRSLYDLLVGQLGTSHPRGEQTELRPSADGKTLQVLLRDRRGKRLESTLLREKDDYVTGRTGLSVKVPAGVGETGVTNLGVFAGGASVTICPTAAGGLRGRQSESGAGFIFFMIPIAGTSEENYHWPLLVR